MINKGPSFQDNGRLSREQQNCLKEIIATHLKKTEMTEERGMVLDLPAEFFSPGWKVIVIKKPGQKTANKMETFSYLFNLASSIGKGGQGEVLLAECLSHPNTLVAVKKQTPNSISFQEDAERERRNLKLCGRFIGCASDREQNEFTVMSYFPGKSLLQLLYKIEKSKNRDGKNFKEKNKVPFLLQLFLGITAIQSTIELHELKLAHRDIKCENFVVDVQRHLSYATVLKLIDLGTGIYLGKENPEKCSEIAGTFGYNDPELSQSSNGKIYYDFRHDYFSLGVVLAEIFTRYNYQHLLRKELRKLKKNNHKKELSFEEIAELMPDYLKADSAFDEGEEEENEIRQKVKKLIIGLMRPTGRFELDDIKEILTQLKVGLTKLYIPLDPFSPSASRQEFNQLCRGRRLSSSAPILPGVSKLAMTRLLRSQSEPSYSFPARELDLHQKDYQNLSTPTSSQVPPNRLNKTILSTSESTLSLIHKAQEKKELLEELQKLYLFSEQENRNEGVLEHNEKKPLIYQSILKKKSHKEATRREDTILEERKYGI